ncbi:MAG: DUF2730 domain-containing protein [Paraglaciecola sp.]|nr:DUF2730 domain-containing protein [Paraglaciecola sp.]
MKTLFFIAALTGSVYLIMQTSAGKTWWEDINNELEVQHNIKPEIKEGTPNKQQVSKQVLQSLENKMSEFVQSLNQKQQIEIDLLQSRIAELENELVIGRITNKQQQQSVPSSKVTVHPYKQSEQQFVAQSPSQVFEVSMQTQDKFAAISDKQLQRNRQARLQDIASKMEMSSLQALVN